MFWHKMSWSKKKKNNETRMGLVFPYPSLVFQTDWKVSETKNLLQSSSEQVGDTPSQSDQQFLTDPI